MWTSSWRKPNVRLVWCDTKSMACSQTRRSTYKAFVDTLIFCFDTSKSTFCSFSPGRSILTTMAPQCVEELSTSLSPRNTSSVPTFCFMTISNLVITPTRSGGAQMPTTSTLHHKANTQ